MSLSLSSPCLRLHIRALLTLRTHVQCVSPLQSLSWLPPPPPGEGQPFLTVFSELRSQTTVHVAIKVFVYIPCSPNTIHLGQCAAYSIQYKSRTGAVARSQAYLWKAVSIFTGQNARFTSYETTYSETFSYLNTRTNNIRRLSGSQL